MMGRHERQKELFSYRVDLDRRVRGDHLLRRVCSMVDFTFVRTAVEHTYGSNGKPCHPLIVAFGMDLAAA
jgi:transposase